MTFAFSVPSSMDTSDETRTDEVETSGGRVRGIKEGEISCFLGIPYAAPPFGDNRLFAERPSPRRGTACGTRHIRADRSPDSPSPTRSAR